MSSDRDNLSANAKALYFLVLFLISLVPVFLLWQMDSFAGFESKGVKLGGGIAAFIITFVAIMKFGKPFLMPLFGRPTEATEQKSNDNAVAKPNEAKPVETTPTPEPVASESPKPEPVPEVITPEPNSENPASPEVTELMDHVKSLESKIAALSSKKEDPQYQNKSLVLMQVDGLKNNFIQLNDIISKLYNSLIHENDPAQKIKLENQIKERKGMLADLGNEITKLEEQL